MIAALLPLLLASSGVLAARFNATLPARDCATYKDPAACATDVNSNTFSALVNATPAAEKPIPTVDPTVEPAPNTKMMERRLIRTIRPKEDESFSSAKAQPVRTIRPVEERAILSSKKSLSLTQVTIPTRTRTRTSIVTTRTIIPTEETAFRLAKDVPIPTEKPASTSRTRVNTKTKTRTRTTRTIAPIEERAFLPIEDVPTYTIKPKPTTKTRIGPRATPTIVPPEERLIWSDE